MSTRYISLINWTEQGVKNAQETVTRLEAARTLWASKGARILDVYWTIGNYDMVVISEAPNDEVVTQLALSVAKGGAIRTSSMRAFNVEEMRRIVAGIA